MCIHCSMHWWPEVFNRNQSCAAPETSYGYMTLEVLHLFLLEEKPPGFLIISFQLLIRKGLDLAQFLVK